MVVQSLRLHTPNAGGLSSQCRELEPHDITKSLELNIPHAIQR